MLFSNRLECFSLKFFHADIGFSWKVGGYPHTLLRQTL
jgi:hypothetical protein